jgi:hypothetical protein
MNHLGDLNRCLDQSAHMSMKIPVLGFTFGILVATLIGGYRPATTVAIRYLRSSHGLTASGPARDRAVRLRMVLLCRTRIGNPRAAITAYAQTMNGSTSLMMQ